MRLRRPGAVATGALTAVRGALEALLAQCRSHEEAARAELARARADLDRALRRLTIAQSAFARALAGVGRTGSAAAAHWERAVVAAGSDLALRRAETEELQKHALAAIRRREAVDALTARRAAESAAREARKEERELDEANQP